MHPASALQVEGQAALDPLHRYGEQEGEEPPPPLATVVQVPLAEAPSAVEQASQPPAQALSQQKPSTQLPVAHWLLAVQAVPWDFFAEQSMVASQ
jgi:hypothetical protein